jgi:hypothetical protein
MGTVNTKKGMTIGETDCRSTITDENTMELVFRCLLEDGNAVWIVQFNVLTIFWGSKVGGFVVPLLISLARSLTLKAVEYEILTPISR